MTIYLVDYLEENVHMEEIGLHKHGLFCFEGTESVNNFERLMKSLRRKDVEHPWDDSLFLSEELNG